MRVRIHLRAVNSLRQEKKSSKCVAYRISANGGNDWLSELGDGRPTFQEVGAIYLFI